MDSEGNIDLFKTFITRKKNGLFGIITYRQNLTPKTVLVAAVVKSIKAVAVKAVEVVDAGVWGSMDAVEAADTKEGDVVAVGRVIPLAASMLFMYQITNILPMN